MLEAVEDITDDFENVGMPLEDLSLSKNLEDIVECIYQKDYSLINHVGILFVVASPSSNPESVHEWLDETIGLPQYSDLFVVNGFDELRFLVRLMLH